MNEIQRLAQLQLEMERQAQLDKEAAEKLAKEKIAAHGELVASMSSDDPERIKMAVLRCHACGLSNDTNNSNSSSSSSSNSRYLFISEAVFYYNHRLLHLPWFYKRVHKIHHEFTAPIGLAAIYLHWFESLLSLGVALTGPMISITCINAQCCETSYKTSGVNFIAAPLTKDTMTTNVTAPIKGMYKSGAFESFVGGA